MVVKVGLLQFNTVTVPNKILGMVKMVHVPRIAIFSRKLLQQLCHRHLSVRPHASEAGHNPTQLQNDAVDIFNTAVNSVLPRTMVHNALQIEDGHLVVDGRTYPLHKNVHVVAFGKAVIGMVRAVEDIIGDHIVGGVASVPTGIQKTLTNLGKWNMLPRQDSPVRVIEGANNNIPDAAAQHAAMEIFNLVKKLRENDLLLTLISGGGSALLPSPTPPITLQDMAHVTRLLSRNGATIQQLNTVRKQLEILKGGGLALAAKPAQVVSLILSDVIGDSLDVIASGPTVLDRTTGKLCLDLFHKLDVEDDIPKTVVEFLRNKSLSSSLTEQKIDNVHNVIVGSNKIAVDAASERAQSLGYIPFVLSTELEGEAKETGMIFSKLANYICSSLGVPLSLLTGVSSMTGELELVQSGIPKDVINELRRALDVAKNSSRPLSIIGAGETVVNVKGPGKGGRNQELALAAALSMQEHLEEALVKHFEVQLLSAGTDGQDGPTEAAGAIVDPELVARSRKQGLDPQWSLNQNDTFSFFSELSGGKNLVRTGLTGTNVMDVQVMLIKPRNAFF